MCCLYWGGGPREVSEEMGLSGEEKLLYVGIKQRAAFQKYI